MHIRGTDFKKNFDGHPIAIGVENFIQSTKKAMKEYEYEQVFLATDTIEALKLFQKEFGDKLVFYEDIQRSDGDIGLHYLESDRKNHHYMLGLEVLRDAYTLASCTSLLAGMSNVSFAAQYIKLANGSTYEDVKILDHGINNNSNSDKKWAKRYLKENRGR